MIQLVYAGNDKELSYFSTGEKLIEYVIVALPDTGKTWHEILGYMKYSSVRDHLCTVIRESSSK